MPKRSGNSPGHNACDLPSTSQSPYPIDSDEPPEPDNWGDQKDYCEDEKVRLMGCIEKLENEKKMHKKKKDKLTEDMEKMKETVKNLQSEKDKQKTEKEKEQEEKLALKRQIEEIQHSMEKLQKQLDEERIGKAPRREEVDMNFNVDFDNGMGHDDDVEEEVDDREDSPIEAMIEDNEQEDRDDVDDDAQRQRSTALWSAGINAADNLEKLPAFANVECKNRIRLHHFFNPKGTNQLPQVVNVIPAAKSLWTKSVSDKVIKKYHRKRWIKIREELLEEQDKQVASGIICLSVGKQVNKRKRRKMRK